MIVLCVYLFGMQLSVYLKMKISNATDCGNKMFTCMNLRTCFGMTIEQLKMLLDVS